MRVDGKFMVGNDIPEGQARASELLHECFELNYELRVAAEEKTASDNSSMEEKAEAENSGGVEEPQLI